MTSTKFIFYICTYLINSGIISFRYSYYCFSYGNNLNPSLSLAFINEDTTISARLSPSFIIGVRIPRTTVPIVLKFIPPYCNLSVALAFKSRLALRPNWYAKYPAAPIMTALSVQYFNAGTVKLMSSS